MNLFDYTVSSTDYNHNGTIHVNLTNPQTEYCKMTITSLTTMANIIVLGAGDYFVINNLKYTIFDDYCDVSPSSLTVFLNSIIRDPSGVVLDDIEFMYDNCNRIYIRSNYEITLTDCSYNMRLLLGLVNVKLPITSQYHYTENGVDEYTLLFPDVGMFLSTPVLYLASNLGSNSYKITTGTTSMRILMRINNSFFAKQPILATNGDYTTICRCSDLSDVRFTLLDANYHEIKLLSPMYLTVQIEAIPDKETKEYDMSKGPVNESEVISMTPYAYMHDLTERGRDVDTSQIDKLVYIDQPKG